MDIISSRTFHNAGRSYRKARAGGQLSASQSCCRTDDGYLVINYIWSTSFLCSARCIKGKNIRQKKLMFVHLLVVRGVHFKTNLADLTQPSESWDNLVYLSSGRLLLFKGQLVWRMWPVWPLPFDSVLQARMMSWPSTSQLGASWWLTWHQFSALIAWLSNSFVFALSILQNATTIKSVFWKENDSCPDAVSAWALRVSTLAVLSEPLWNVNASGALFTCGTWQEENWYCPVLLCSRSAAATLQLKMSNSSKLRVVVGLG